MSGDKDKDKTRRPDKRVMSWDLQGNTVEEADRKLAEEEKENG